ncbi:MAG: fibronectin type III domain-containing protein [Methanococcaceae archaeon]
MKKLFIHILFFLLITVFYSCDRNTNINSANDELPPAVPVGLQIYSAHDGRIIIDWYKNKESDLKEYYIYRSLNDTLSFRKIASTTDYYYIDDSLDYDRTYFYKISAIDVVNNESMKTGWVSASPANLNPPATPQSLNINARNWNDSISVFLSWAPNNEGDIAGYEVFRSTSPDFIPGSESQVGFATLPTFSDTKNLNLYTTYYYKLIAVDKGGLKSSAGPASSDMILGIPEIVFPGNNTSVTQLDNFIIKALPVPTTYKLVVQSNQYFGEIWSTDYSTEAVDQDLSINFSSSDIYANKIYYWRVITYTGNEPNSISPLFNFLIKP